MRRSLANLSKNRRNRRRGYITSIIIPLSVAGLMMSGCSNSDDTAREKMSPEAVGNAAAGGAVTGAASEASEIAAENVSIESADSAFKFGALPGVMSLDVDLETFDRSGIIEAGAGKGEIVYMIFDPKCESCRDVGGVLETAGIQIRKVPVGFYTPGSLKAAVDIACRSQGHERGSEACEQVGEAVTRNSEWVVMSGAVELPAFIVGGQKLIEGWESEDALMQALTGGRYDG